MLQKKLLNTSVSFFHSPSIFFRLKVVLGELNTNTLRDCVKTPFGERCSDAPIKLGVESVTIHPQYNGKKDFDIAILKLEKEVQFSGEYLNYISKLLLTRNLQISYNPFACRRR